MRWDNQSLAQQVLKRATALQQKKKCRQIRIFAVLSTTSCMGLLFFVSVILTKLDGVMGNAGFQPSAYGTLMMGSDKIGGYLTIGALAFLCGTLVTLACLWLRKKI